MLIAASLITAHKKLYSNKRMSMTIEEDEDDEEDGPPSRLGRPWKRSICGSWRLWQRDYGVDPLSHRLPPPPFPMRPLELGSPGMLPPLCSLSLWSILELPTGTSRASETVRGGSQNPAEAYANPVIKILQWMLILWKKPNHFIVCLISETGGESKSIQQNRSTAGNPDQRVREKNILCSQSTSLGSGHS